MQSLEAVVPYNNATFSPLFTGFDTGSHQWTPRSLNGDLFPRAGTCDRGEKNCDGGCCGLTDTCCGKSCCPGMSKCVDKNEGYCCYHGNAKCGNKGCYSTEYEVCCPDTGIACTKGETCCGTKCCLKGFHCQDGNKCVENSGSPASIQLSKSGLLVTMVALCTVFLQI